jgi:hypothetical protein
MANIQIADLAQIENQFDELSDLELEVVGGRIYYVMGRYYYSAFGHVWNWTSWW